MSSEKLPVITDELIFALDQIFPNRHPDLSLSDREVWYRAGQHYVVDFLIEQQKRQRIRCSISLGELVMCLGTPKPPPLPEPQLYCTKTRKDCSIKLLLVLKELKNKINKRKPL